MKKTEEIMKKTAGIEAPGTDLEGRINFIMLVSVKGANPNGDPDNEGRPRQDRRGYGLITNQCIGHYIRLQLHAMGEPVFVLPDEIAGDGHKSLQARAAANKAMEAALARKDLDRWDQERLYRNEACKAWTDVRMFGQLFAFKASGDRKSRSTGITGPVEINDAHSVDPVTVSDIAITRCLNAEDTEDKASDTMGRKAVVDYGLYVTQGCVNVVPAQRTGLSKADVALLKEALPHIFENGEASSKARPNDSVKVEQVYWFEQDSALPRVTADKILKALHIKAKNDDPLDFEDYVVEWTGAENCADPELLV